MKDKIIYWICGLVMLFFGVHLGAFIFGGLPVESAALRSESILVESAMTLPVLDVEPAYTDEQLEILAIIIYQEAGGDMYSDSTRQMVGEVFLNRVASPHYPDTFHEVATQRAQYGRLHWTGLVWPDRADKPEEAYAVQRAYYIATTLLSNAVERLLPTDTIYQAEFEQGKEVVKHQDGTYFCR